jgi:hypothetical protein
VDRWNFVIFDDGGVTDRCVRPDAPLAARARPARPVSGAASPLLADTERTTFMPGVFALHGMEKESLDIFILSHFLDANRYPLRLKML